MEPTALSMTELVDENRKLKNLVDDLMKQLPPTGIGLWRQGVENPRSIYVHQPDDAIGQPVGQMYSPKLAALVCEALNEFMSHLDQEKKA